MRQLGTPRLHHRQIDSTNLRARQLAEAGAPHGTLVTAGEQVAGRGRQGRRWSSPPGTSLSMSVIVREPSQLLSLAAGVAVADTVDAVRFSADGIDPIDSTDPTAPRRVSKNSPGVGRIRHAPAGKDAPALIKWPNDILVDGRKVAGILVEGRPLERWAVLGIGINVAVPEDSFPPDLRARAGTLGLPTAAVEPTLTLLLGALERWFAAPAEQQLTAVRERDALLGQSVEWAQGFGTAAGIDAAGRLLVDLGSAGGHRVALDAGEVHLSGAGGPQQTR